MSMTELDVLYYFACVCAVCLKGNKYSLQRNVSYAFTIIDSNHGNIRCSENDNTISDNMKQKMHFNYDYNKLVIFVSASALAPCITESSAIQWYQKLW